MAAKQNTMIVILTAVLLAVVAASVLLLWMAPSDDPSVPIAGSGANPARQSDTTPGFNLTAIQSSAYQLLSKQLVLEGLLPVRPPAIVGKANPFL